MKHKVRSILIIGGVHGDESTGVGVVNVLNRLSSSLTSIIAHPQAVKVKKRFLETDLNRSFNSTTAVSLEEYIASELQIYMQKFDLIIDIHNTKARNNSCAIVTSKPNILQKKIALLCGFKKMLIMPPSNSLIAVNYEKSISLEISESDKKFYTAGRLAWLLDNLYNSVNEDLDFTDLSIYEYVSKVPTTTLRRLGISKSSMQNFIQLPTDIKLKLGLKKSKRYYPCFLKTKKVEEIAFTLVAES